MRRLYRAYRSLPGTTILPVQRHIKGKTHIHKIQARIRCNARNKKTTKTTTTKERKKVDNTKVEKR